MYGIQQVSIILMHKNKFIILIYFNSVYYILKYLFYNYTLLLFINLLLIKFIIKKIFRET